MPTAKSAAPAIATTISATPTAVQQTCVLKATAMKDGLYASAARCVSFGEPDPEFRREFETACRLGAVCLLVAQDAGVARLVNNHCLHGRVVPSRG